MTTYDDMRQLLKKYMHHIIDCESVDYLSRVTRYSDEEPYHSQCTVRFSDDELAELQKISSEYAQR